MKGNYSTRFAAMTLLVGALACAGNTAREADTDESAAARDTTSSDTLGGQNPSGYRGMETDTTVAPNGQPSDTFIQNQGTGQAQDTAGYSGMERVDTTGQQGQMDTTGQTDTTGGWNADSSSSNQNSGVNQTGMDTTGSATGDTTGYDNSQPSDTTTSR